MSKSLLYTGAGGFLGKNTIPKLIDIGFDVSTLGRRQSDFVCDLSLQQPQFSKHFDTVIHAAGKAHSVPRTEAEKQLFYDINLTGTVNLCMALEACGLPRHFVFISTVAVYGVDEGENITEDFPLQGNTPYALSKIAAENFLKEWCATHKVKLSILRPSLIAGANPPGNLGAMISGIQSGRYFRIAGGRARKSVLMAVDLANLLPLLENSDGGIFNICDNHHPSFSELEEVICKQLGKKTSPSIPYWLARSLAFVGDCIGEKAPINSSKLNKIAHSLVFNNDKAKKELGWQPLDVLTHFTIR